MCEEGRGEESSEPLANSFESGIAGVVLDDEEPSLVEGLISLSNKSEYL